MTILMTLFISIFAYSHQDFQSLSCHSKDQELSIAKEKRGYTLNLTKDGKPATPQSIAKFEISDEVDPKSGQVLDVYKGQNESYSIVAKRPETKGPQKVVRTVMTQKKKQNKSTTFENCRITF